MKTRLWIIALATLVWGQSLVAQIVPPSGGGGSYILTKEKIAEASGVTNGGFKINGIPVVNGGSGTITASAVVPLKLTSSDSLEINSGVYSLVDVSVAANITIPPPTNAPDGKKVQWRLYGNGSEYDVAFSHADIIIPESSQLTSPIVVSNGYVNILFMDAYILSGKTNWLVEAYIPRYKIQTP